MRSRLKTSLGKHRVDSIIVSPKTNITASSLLREATVEGVRKASIKSYNIPRCKTPAIKEQKTIEFTSRKIDNFNKINNNK
jgi:hypothetical protein